MAETPRLRFLSRGSHCGWLVEKHATEVRTMGYLGAREGARKTSNDCLGSVAR